MSDKSKRILELLEKVQLPWRPPDYKEVPTLLEMGLLSVLVRRLTESQALATLKALKQVYPDWNELRIAQSQEFRDLVKGKRPEEADVVAAAVKEYLTEIFWRNHGFDLEPLRQDHVQAAKFFSDLPYLGASASHALLGVALGGDLAVSPAIIRLLDRLGIVKRLGSVKKTAEALEPLVPAERRNDFALVLGAVVENWCDARRPRCWECPLLDECPHGKKVFKDWKAQQVRLEAQRKRDEARLAVQRKKDEERRKKDEAREKKQAERDAERRARERERAQRAEAKRQKVEEKQRLAAEKKLAADKKKAEAERRAEAERQAEARKAGKRSDKKAPKKVPAKRPAKAQKANGKPSASKKPASQKGVARKTR